MAAPLSRRTFLKIAGLALGGLAFTPVFPREQEYDLGEIVRITIGEVDLRAEPRDDSDIIGKRYRDQLVHIYEEVTSPKGPSWNPLWYRVWGGYIHSAYTQKVKVGFNSPLSYIPDAGQLCELTVPYTIAYQNDPWQGWHPWDGVPLYYSTTHWITGIEDGPDKEPWYQLTSEIDSHLKYYIPAIHARSIPDAELAPISPDVPPEKKRIEVSLYQQTLTAYENDKAVLSTKISSGIPSRRTGPNDLPTNTPVGSFRIYSKMPNKHMGQVSGNPDAQNRGGFSLPGVPWTCFFAFPGGYAFHGTFWHDNFGIQMSHGCVNMQNEDAKWLFRWSTPVYKTPIESRSDWEQRGNGTQVIIH